MPTKKIKDLEGYKNGFPCLNPEHNPPNMMVYKSGVYEHTCPGCGHVQIFTVARVIHHIESPIKHWRWGAKDIPGYKPPRVMWNEENRRYKWHPKLDPRFV